MQARLTLVTRLVRAESRSRHIARLHRYLVNLLLVVLGLAWVGIGTFNLVQGLSDILYSLWPKGCGPSAICCGIRLEATRFRARACRDSRSGSLPLRQETSREAVIVLGGVGRKDSGDDVVTGPVPEVRGGPVVSLERDLGGDLDGAG